MSLQYAVLGLLAEAPRSGYELVREFDYARSVIWPAPQNEIYRELAKLLKKGAIAEEEKEGPRGRRRYRIEDKGRELLRNWLLSAEADFTLRYEPILRAVFFGLLSEEDWQARLEKDLPFYHEQISVLEKAEAAAQRQQDPRRFGRRQALGLYRALRDWSGNCLGQIPAGKGAAAWQIDEAKPDDACTLAMLGASVFLDTYAPEGIGTALANYCAREFTAAKLLERLKQPKRTLFVVRSTEALLAFADLELDSKTPLANTAKQAELVQLYVSRHAAGRGLGKALLKACCEKAGRENAELLWLSAYHGNKTALLFYQKAGFRDLGSIDFDLEGEKHENRVLGLNLPASKLPERIQKPDLA